MEPLLLDIPEEIFTDRLLIRTARAGDGPMIHTAASETHEQLRQWMPWAAGELKVEEFELFARRAIAGFASRTQFHLLLMLRTTNEFVGTCGFHKINWSVPACEIGYWLRQSQQGCGLMNEAVIRVTQFAFSLGIRRVELRCDARNDRSVRVAERAGFQLEEYFAATPAAPMPTCATPRFFRGSPPRQGCEPDAARHSRSVLQRTFADPSGPRRRWSPDQCRH